MTSHPSPDITVHRLGLVEYQDGLQLQRLFAQARGQGLVGDSLLLLEHPPVLTLGRGAKRENILGDAARLAQEGVEVFETDRGGDVTYHGPGQLVGYPIFLLPPERHDVRRYVRSVEESLLRTLSTFGLEARRIPKWPGVWMGDEGRDARKIAAIGVHISRWLTTHGFALNVQPRLEHFDFIVPCGIRDAGVTSMERELGHRLAFADVQETCSGAFGAVFEAPLKSAPEAQRTVSVVVLRRAPSGPEVLLLQRSSERGGFWQPVTGRCEPGESAAAAARRELYEETGQECHLLGLDYVHAFGWGEELPPRVVEETAFGVAWPAGAAVRLGPEHQASEWLPVELAAQRVPFAGLRVAILKAVRKLGL